MKKNLLKLVFVSALVQDEGGYDDLVWERYYRPEGDGYNCTRGGSESC